MVKFNFFDVDAAFQFVSGDESRTSTALLCKDTGKILYQSELAELDEIEEEEDLDLDQSVEVPHKKDLGLGTQIVFEFIEEHLPDDYEDVRDIFRKRGAYARYKDLLIEREMLEKWYAFENTREAEALRNWCHENGIELEQQPVQNGTDESNS